MNLCTYAYHANQFMLFIYVCILEAASSYTYPCTNMVSVNSENDPGILNPIFESEDDKKSPTVPNIPAVAILEFKIADENPTKKEENKFYNALRGKWITMQQYTHLVPLIISMVIVVAILQIPTILYYTDPPSAEFTLLDNVDLESCSVS